MMQAHSTATRPVENLRALESRSDRGPLLAGVGAIAFGILTIVAVFVANAPGGNYSLSSVTDYLAHGHRIAAIVVTQLALLAILGLICLLAQLRDTISIEPANKRAGTIVWGTGVAAAAAFAIGWGVLGGQIVAHLEGGSPIVIPPAVTYLISEIGAVFIFGCGAALLGLALIVLMLNSRTTLPTWLRRLTLFAGLCGIAGLAYFTFFVLMIWGVVIGIWLLSTRGNSLDAAAATAPTD
jgi:hypothetical protein